LSGGGSPLRRLIERHCEVMRDSVAALGCHLDGLWPRSAASPEALRKAADIVHRLAGAGGSIGFHDVTDRARALERALLTVAVAEPPAESERGRVMAAFRRLALLVDAVTPEASALYNADPLGPRSLPGAGDVARGERA
jgi:hypothetical protein